MSKTQTMKVATQTMKVADKKHEYFKFGKIPFEGPKSNNDLAFKYYDKDRVILGKKMSEWLRFSLTYWHTFESVGGDQFGDRTRTFEWDLLSPMDRARAKVDVAFELFEKMGVEFFAFHDKDIAPETNDINEYFKNVDEIVDLIAAKMKKTKIKLLWNTSNLFSHRRYAMGAGTSPEFDVFAYAAAQTKHNLDIAKKLDAKGFTFWGGREGYETLINTRMGQELDQMAALLTMALDYAKKIGFKGQFYIEPKAKEPMTHQYDFDTATVLGFLRKYGLEKQIKVNIEQNHALLAGHTFQHELMTARENGILGSLDSNQGNPLLGWDTDQFPYDIYEATLAMYEIIKNKGIAPGGLNFDAKLRRQSSDINDLAYGAILGMDTYAKGLIVAAKLFEDKVLEKAMDERYKSWNGTLAKKAITRKATLEEVAKHGMAKNIQSVTSSHEELLEAKINKYIFETK